jgi:hypothetical protein
VRYIILTALGTTTVAAMFLVLVTQPISIIGFYRENLAPEMFALWLAGLVVATLAPPAIAITFWWVARRVRHAWVLHVLLLPVIYSTVSGTIAIMLRAANEPDSDSLTGWATDPAVLLMLVCSIAYFLALGARNVGRLRRKSTER